MSTKPVWSPQSVIGDEDRLLDTLAALEEAVAILRANPRRSLALQERIDGFESTIGEFYGRADQAHISPSEWTTASRADLTELATQVWRLAEVDFLVWLSCRPAGEVLGLAGLESGVLHHYLSRTLDIPLSAVISERQYVLLSDGRRTLRAELPIWAAEINRLTNYGIYSRPGVRVTARGLRWLLRLPRARAISGERRDA